ncbi:Helix-loop-helix DNA-binding domain protein [Trichinella nativa]|uniref:Helix-loop-helix DNA-binding domain protein n=1 Tax=Trichinella nativa TaxID=6335 RepID=A0A1Y3E3M3_9BILA|nr:Helix-loop-helix DNA-binding domain protein [Trichinella nativa]
MYIKFFSMDRKKEHSRHLAQRRRNLENLEYENLSRVLPVHQAISGSLLNKTKILRLAANYLKLKTLLHSSLPENVTCMPKSREEKQYDIKRNSLLSCAKFHENAFHFFEPTVKILDVIDGFLFCLDEAATLLYASETISIGFGLSQINLIGNSFLDYLYTSDHDIFCNFLHHLKNMGSNIAAHRLATVELNIVPILGSDNSENSQVVGFAGIAIPLLFQMQLSPNLNSRSFVMMADLDLTIRYMCDETKKYLKCSNIASKLIGTTLYKIIHPNDIYIVRQLHQETLRCGGSRSDYFNILSFPDNSLLTVQVNAAKINKSDRFYSQSPVVIVLVFLIVN